ncbi:MAG: GIY-YIG nuclease family protein [Bacteroidales bacterium]|nr:GIY-YIG nuclease family protein [Bacteroidales bacterium]
MTVREKIALFPHSPGVYRYYDAEGNVIYVGKAKDLHKRVAQYFVPPERLTTKTRILVSKIADAQYSVVDTEADALLLENNLIKQYKPRYNILLKDSKTYPWICVTGDEFPRVFITRRIDKSQGTGTSARTVPLCTRGTSWTSSARRIRCAPATSTLPPRPS